jgi:RNA polymerase nonessential primary-like sigma factor|tara:strand:+ start:388 stop:669 length:282 start_codon:yes stop_codon:yes gene_type:complete
MHETVADPTDAIDEQRAHSAMGTDLLSAVAQPSPIQARAIVHYYGLQGHAPQTLEQIGRAEDVSRERIRQIKEQALNLLRKKIPAPKAYLQAS